ncbi:MAG: TatD family hydrolase [Candidatus Sungbacteria bacterium]|nr:TatD family hydrolase [Candidatus Sungbacteria bacterium]
MSTLKLFDVHTHTQFAAFKDEIDVVIKRALDAGIWLVNVGTQRDTSAKAVEIANKYSEGVYATVGLHPIHTEKSFHDEKELGALVFSNSRELENKNLPGFLSRAEEFDYEYYKKLAEDPKVVAIGECGLDYYRTKNLELRTKQFDTFKKQIELAVELKKPLMIHCRNAFEDLIDILQTTNYKLKSGIIHFFSGTVEDARKLLDLGFSFSFGGVITFTRDYDEVVKYMPLERILLETDAPYVAPVPYRGKRNEPLYVVEVAKKIAELKAVAPGDIERITTENALKIFGIKNDRD